MVQDEWLLLWCLLSADRRPRRVLWIQKQICYGGLPNFPALPKSQNPVHQKSKSLQPVIAKCILQLKLRAHNHFVMHGYRLFDQLSIWNQINIDEKHKRVITWSSGSATTTIMATPTLCMTGVTDGVCSPWAAGTLTHGASAGARMQTFPLCTMFSIHPKWFNGKAEQQKPRQFLYKCMLGKRDLPQKVWNKLSQPQRNTNLQEGGHQLRLPELTVCPELMCGEF